MLDTGRPGEWDSGGAYSLDVIQSRDGFHIWYAGNAPRKDGKGETIRIGYAVSNGH